MNIQRFLIVDSEKASAKAEGLEAENTKLNQEVMLSARTRYSTSSQTSGIPGAVEVKSNQVPSVVGIANCQSLRFTEILIPCKQSASLGFDRKAAVT